MRLQSCQECRVLPVSEQVEVEDTLILVCRLSIHFPEFVKQVISSSPEEKNIQ